MIDLDDRIHCVSSTDENYCQHLAVSIASLLNNNPPSSIVFHVVHHGLTAESVARLQRLVGGFAGATLVLHPFDADKWAHFRLDGHIKLASYFRLFLTDILPETLDRVIYIDADTVVLGALVDLWRLDLDGALIGAIPDLYMLDNARLGLAADYVYFNAGVLLVDLRSWRRDDVRDELIRYVESNMDILMFHDQDALNGVLQGRRKLLGFEWNFQPRFTPEDVAPLGLTPDAFKRIQAKPRIVHFTTANKPWQYRPNVRFEKFYLKYLKETPWRAYRAPDKNGFTVFKRLLKTMFPSLYKGYQAQQS